MTGSHIFIYMYPSFPVKRRLDFSPYAKTATPRPYQKRRFFNASSAAGGVRRFAGLNKARLGGLTTTGSLKSQVKSLQRYVKKLAPEVKNADISINASNVTNTGNVIHISAIAQGSNVSNRIGDSINVTRIDFGVEISKSTDAPGPITAGVVRFAIVQDKQQVPDTAPAAVDIWTSANPLTAFPNVAQQDRFRVLYMSPVMSIPRMSLDTDTNVGIPTANNWVTGSVTCNITVEYNGTASTDQQKNGLYFVTLTDDAVGTMDTSGSLRISFTDS